MQTVGVRDLVNRASALLDELEHGGQPIIVTRRGQPIAVLSAIDAEEFYRESLYGDPVEITNAPGPAMTETDALYDWIYSPAEWQALSALS